MTVITLFSGIKVTDRFDKAFDIPSHHGPVIFKLSGTVMAIFLEIPPTELLPTDPHEPLEPHDIISPTPIEPIVTTRDYVVTDEDLTKSFGGIPVFRPSRTFASPSATRVELLLNGELIATGNFTENILLSASRSTIESTIEATSATLSVRLIPSEGYISSGEIDCSLTYDVVPPLPSEPVITGRSNADIHIIKGEGTKIWIKVKSEIPHSYQIHVNKEQAVKDKQWQSGIPIEFNLQSLEEGINNIKILVSDSKARSVYADYIINVTLPSAGYPLITSSSANQMEIIVGTPAVIDITVFHLSPKSVTWTSDKGSRTDVWVLPTQRFTYALDGLELGTHSIFCSALNQIDGRTDKEFTITVREKTEEEKFYDIEICPFFVIFLIIMGFVGTLMQLTLT